MVVAKKDLRSVDKDQNNSFCLKVVTHPSTNPARPGLASELVLLYPINIFHHLWSHFSSQQYISNI